MSKRQQPLFAKDRREVSPDAIKRALSNVSRTLTPLAKVSKADPGQAFSAWEKAIAALRDLDAKLEDWIGYLDAQQAPRAREREEALDRRREALARAADEVGWRVVRRRDYDVVDCFRVDYSKGRVTIRLGSEKLDAFDEVDGKRLFARLQASREALDSFPFDRLGFFQILKDAIDLAQSLRPHRDGRVPIRRLYPLVVLARQARNERFLKKPDSKTFADYPMIQFVYDFARFGREGWKTERNERVSNQPPNMAAIAKGASLTLPVLDGRDTDGAQLGSIWIERSRSA